MKQFCFIFMLIFISFLMFSCKKEDNTSNDKSYISNVSYKVIDYGHYNKTQKEKTILEEDYKDLLLGQKAILVVEFDVDGKNKDSNDDMYT